VELYVIWKYNTFCEKKNELAPAHAEMGMIRWMCGVQQLDKYLNTELRDRLGSEDDVSLLQQYMSRWYQPILRMDDSDWMKRCTAYEVDDARLGGRPMKTWQQVVRSDFKHFHWDKFDAVDRKQWRKLGRGRHVSTHESGESE